jgi:hypothetical protein
MDDFNNQIVKSIEVSAKGIDTVRKIYLLDKQTFYMEHLLQISWDLEYISGINNIIILIY